MNDGIASASVHKLRDIIMKGSWFVVIEAEQIIRDQITIALFSVATKRIVKGLKQWHQIAFHIRFI